MMYQWCFLVNIIKWASCTCTSPREKNKPINNLTLYINRQIYFDFVKTVLVCECVVTQRKKVGWTLPTSSFFNVVLLRNWITQVYPQQALCMSNPISHPPEREAIIPYPKVDTVVTLSHKMQHKIPSVFNLVTKQSVLLSYNSICCPVLTVAPVGWLAFGKMKD